MARSKSKQIRDQMKRQIRHKMKQKKLKQRIAEQKKKK
jgi:hypothetical protein